MSIELAIYLAGVVIVGGFFIGAIMSDGEERVEAIAAALLLALIWPLAVAGAIWAQVFKWAERQK